jgi:hypothetical protein
MDLRISGEVASCTWRALGFGAALDAAVWRRRAGDKFPRVFDDIRAVAFTKRFTL